MFVPDEAGVDAGAGGVIDGKVAKFVVATEQVALLLVHHEFLDHLSVLQDVEMQAGRRLPGPRGNVETAGVRHGARGWPTRTSTRGLNVLGIAGIHLQSVLYTRKGAWER